MRTALKIKLLGISLAALGLFGAAPASKAATEPDFGRSDTITTQSPFRYRFLLPPGYNQGDTATKYPLIVFLHGLGERRDDAGSNGVQLVNGMLNMVTEPIRQAHKFILVAPLCTTAEEWQWNSTNDKIITLIDTLSATYNIDPDRIIITGLSLGGLGSWAAISRNPTKFAAAAPLSSAGNPGIAPTIKNVPVWAFLAQDDGLFSVNNSDSDNKMVEAMRAAGGKPIYTQFTQGGHSPWTWSAAYRNPNLIPWMMAQRRGQPNTGIPNVHINLPVTISGTNATLTGTMNAGTLGAIAVAWYSSNPAVSPVGYGTQQGSQAFPCPGSSFTPAITGGLLIVNGGQAIYKITGAPSPTILTVDHNMFWGDSAFKIYPPTSGTLTNWTAANIPLTAGNNQVTVMAMAGSGDPGDPADPNGNTQPLPGNTYFSDVAIVNYTADTTPPIVTINSPTSSPTYSATSTPLTIAGTAADSGSGVSTVTWSNNRGGSGTATGTANWTVGGIVLQSGTNVLTVTATDAAGNPATDVLTVTFSGSTPPSGGTPVRFDFGGTGAITSGNWNNVTSTNPGVKIANAVDTNGAATGIILNIASNFGGIDTAGSTSATGPFPASALQDSFYVQNTAIGNIQLQGLNPSLTYTVTLFASRLGAGANRVTAYTVGATTKTLDALDNTSNTVTFTNVAPGGDGILEVLVKNNTLSGYGYIGVLEVLPTDTTPPTVNITSPTSGPTHTATSTPLTIAGTAADSGSGVSTVTWSNNRGGSGTATGVASWAVGGIVLQSGTNVLTVTATDVAGNVGTDVLTVTYSGSTPPPSGGTPVRFDFGGTGATTSGNWNNVTSSNPGVKIANAIDTSGTATGIILNIASNFGGTDTAGSTSGTGPFPASALQDSFYVQNTSVGNVQVQGLSPTSTYTITLFASHLGTGANRVTAYTVGGTIKTLDATDNTANTVVFTNVAPGPDGILEVLVKSNTGSGYGHIGVLEVKKENRVRFDFGGTGSPSSPNWNNVTSSNPGVKIADAVDTNGAATGIILNIASNFGGTDTAGSTSGTGPFPASAMQDSFFVQNTSVGNVQLQGLNPAKTYTITLFASHLGTGANRVTAYTVGGTTKTLDATANTANTVVFSNVAPGPDGIMEILTKSNTGSGYGHIGVVQVDY